MRLLEFDRDTSGANPRRPDQGVSDNPTGNGEKGHRSDAPPGITPPAPVQRPAPPRPLKQATRRKPIDLEQLQERLGFVERRLDQQTRHTGKFASTRELEKLKLRMQVLERSLEHELGTARDREQRLLQVLDKPSFRMRANQRLMRFWLHDLPLAGDWLREEAREWWRYSQPEWWPRFARAWRQALEQARR